MMDYPLNFASPKKQQKQTKPALQPGTVTSELKCVSDADGYKKGDAYMLTYEIITSDGTVLEKTETFVNHLGNDRTFEFFQYLKENGVELEDFGELIGLRENLTLEWSVSPYSGRRFLNVTNREFLGFTPTKEDAE